MVPQIVDFSLFKKVKSFLVLGPSRIHFSSSVKMDRAVCSGYFSSHGTIDEIRIRMRDHNTSKKDLVVTLSDILLALNLEVFLIALF